jgi:hypothetical protein
MGFCSQCGSALEPTDQFCGTCGARVPVAAPPPVAPPDVPTPTAAPPEIDVPTVPPPMTTPMAPPLAPRANQRLALWGAIVAAIVLLIVGVVLVTRDRGGDLQDAAVTTLPGGVPTTAVAGVPTTEETATTTPTTSAAPTTTPATTEPPMVTTMPATTPPIPSVPAVPAGWNPATIPPQAYPRLSEENLIGVPSPPIVDLTAPLPDGFYRTTYVSNDGINLTLDLYRFELCEILGEGPCIEGPYTPLEIGADEFPTGTIDVPLDATTRAVIVGWDCEQVIEQGNGADLAAMYAALAGDYDLAFSAELAAGTDPYDLMAIVNANPVARFRPPAGVCNDGYSLVWQLEGAPPLLIQYAFDWETGGAADPASLLFPSAIEVSGGNTTVYFYAGFFS